MAARIGITPCSRMDDYVESVKRAGGHPVLLRNSDDAGAVVESLDGLLLTGGLDVDPALYGEPTHATTHTAPDRDRFEVPLSKAAVAHDLPVLAICRGVQVLNVALGGTLYQDLPSEFPNALPHYFRAPAFPRDHPGHTIQVEEESLLARCLGTPLVEVNSRHHQAPRQIAPGLKIVARAPDGVIEALELDDHPFALGVQWHPENLQAQAPMRGLFEQFVEAARRAQR